MNYKSQAATPYVIIASPQIFSGVFHKSVVLILEHDSDGAFGLVLNQPSEIPVRALIAQIELNRTEDTTAVSDMTSVKDIPATVANKAILNGGPLEENQCCLLTAELSLLEPENGIAENIQVLCKGGHPFELIFGYSGWGPNQLDDEIKRGSWFCSDIQLSTLLACASVERYQFVLRQMGLVAEELAAFPHQIPEA